MKSGFEQLLDRALGVVNDELPAAVGLETQILNRLNADREGFSGRIDPGAFIITLDPNEVA